MKNIRVALLLVLGLTILSCGSDDSNPGDFDNQNPTAPQNLTVSNIAINSIELTWDASTDNVGVTGYNIYRNGSLAISDNSGTTAVVTNLDEETLYSFYVTAVDAAGNESVASNTTSGTTEGTPLVLTSRLSELGFFQGPMEDLTPADDVQLYEIRTTLFTDYAAKQRLIKMPVGQSMRYINTDLLPSFPNNTLIAKTFYYYIDERDPSLGKQIIETRVFLKLESGWMATDYVWNAGMTEAFRDDVGGTVPISYIDENGITNNVDYIIPSNTDCFTCHNKYNKTVPIGMKLRNMNFTPTYIGYNQLIYFTDNGLLLGVSDPTTISALPDWLNGNLTLEERSRAYMDVNCAHCHSPGGSVPPTYNIDFTYETDFNETGIYPNRGEIEARFESTSPIYRMPQLGRTVVHQEALVMLRDYLESL
ncbi:MAG: fibronectin type III domain-containing protein [Bacteroidia bacterium]|nr:fibronectin type III domain-containing protein [Bacteroidia bacterium]NNF32364.1 hypothetical protein [Flavobacteriaceae bacterium]MBT8276348.1 fibronectin type III domain-containing protein [Bacteroidia bacterium]NNJ81409.1 hypothetical protein [Flavobacteriaceae bacterium]NNK53240.1 hypothetical protein [Flavobacteriaceae bacterium]